MEVKRKGLEDILTFGRYRGLTVEQVVGEDPDYILWINKTLEYFPLEESVVDLAIETIDAQSNVDLERELRYSMRLADIMGDDY